MTEHDIDVPIGDFMGVSRRVISEALPVPYFDAIQNLWERKLGELQRRGGATAVPMTWPSNIIGIDNGHVLKLRHEIKRKILAVHCSTPTHAAVQALTSSVTMAFVNTSGGVYGTSVGTGLQLNGYNSAVEIYVTLQYVGYGINYMRTALVTAMGSYNTLQITVPTALNENITGINVYVGVQSFTSSSARPSDIWVGFIDLISTPTGVFNFKQAPLTMTAYPSSTVTYGASNPTAGAGYTLEEATGGSLTPGKTYYVLVMPQYMHNANNTVAGSFFRSRVTTPDAITLNAGTAIKIKTITGDSPCYMIAIGEHPQLMQPQFITNVTSEITINSLVANNPNVVDLTPIAVSTTVYNDYKFSCCDNTVTDMLVRFQDDGTIRPIFVSRITDVNQAYFSGTVPLPKNAVITGLDQQVTPFGQGSKYCFAQAGELAYFVNDYSGDMNISISGQSINERFQSGYYQTDGLVAASCVFDNGTTPCPKSKFIATFQESIVMGGGSKASPSYNRLYFSNAYNPYNFSQNGSNAALAYVQVESGGEPITGIGVYSINTSDAGAKTELAVGKTSSIYKLSNLPDSFSGANFMEVLSSKVGIANHYTLKQTEIGTIFTSLDNVYLMSEQGEPTPIGDDIQFFLSPEDPNLLVNTTKWNAVYHDGCYKLAYSVDGSSTPTRELWLNVSKMKANKGMPTWYGPHKGRTFDYSFVDEFFVSGERDRRFGIDVANKRVFIADEHDVATDFGVDPEFILELKQHTGDTKAAYINKLLTRIYWKLKLNGPISFTQEIHADEELVETSQLLCTPKSPGLTYSDFLGQRTAVYSGFPKGRIRGRVLKTKLAYTGPTFFAISGLVLFFRPERRRI